MKVKVTRKGSIDVYKNCRIDFLDGWLAIAQFEASYREVAETKTHHEVKHIIELEVVPNGKDFSK